MRLADGSSPLFSRQAMAGAQKSDPGPPAHWLDPGQMCVDPEGR